MAPKDEKYIYIISANFEHILKIHLFAFNHISDLALRLTPTPHTLLLLTGSSGPAWDEQRTGKGTVRPPALLLRGSLPLAVGQGGLQILRASRFPLHLLPLLLPNLYTHTHTK